MKKAATHFLVINADGTSHATPLPLATNQPPGTVRARSVPAKAPPCTCGNCGKPKPKKARNAKPVTLELLREVEARNTAAWWSSPDPAVREQARFTANTCQEMIAERERAEAKAAAARVSTWIKPVIATG